MTYEEWEDFDRCRSTRGPQFSDIKISLLKIRSILSNTGYGTRPLMRIETQPGVTSFREVLWASRDGLQRTKAERKEV